MPVLDILVSTPVIIIGVAGYCGVVDISTQYAEHKLLRSRRRPQPAPDTPRERHPYPASVPRQPFRLNTGRVIRMTGLGIVSGVFAISFFSVVNHLLPGDPSFSLAVQKAAVAAFIVGPPMFCLQVVVNEVLLHGHFGTVGPKIRQDFLPSVAMNIIYMPISVFGYMLFVNPAHLVLFNAPLSFVFTMGLNYLLNREVEAPDAAAADDASSETSESSERAAPPPSLQKPATQNGGDQPTPRSSSSAQSAAQQRAKDWVQTSQRSAAGSREMEPATDDLAGPTCNDGQTTPRQKQ